MCACPSRRRTTRPDRPVAGPALKPTRPGARVKHGRRACPRAGPTAQPGMETDGSHEEAFADIPGGLPGGPGRAFTGVKQKAKGGKSESEKFSGAIYRDDNTIYIAEHGRGDTSKTPWSRQISSGACTRRKASTARRSWSPGRRSSSGANHCRPGRRRGRFHPDRPAQVLLDARSRLLPLSHSRPQPGPHPQGPPLLANQASVFLFE